MKKLTIENGTVKINASVFIIPNSAARIKDLFEFDQEEKLHQMEEICKVNGLTFDPEKDYLIECWYHSKEYNCDNMPDHNIHCIGEDGCRNRISFPYRRYLPSNIFENHKEGDVINIKLPAILEKFTHYEDNDPEDLQEEEIDIITDIKLELNQLDYRYGRFGPFENVLEKVIGAANR